MGRKRTAQSTAAREMERFIEDFYPAARDIVSTKKRCQTKGSAAGRPATMTTGTILSSKFLPASGFRLWTPHRPDPGSGQMITKNTPRETVPLFVKLTPSLPLLSPGVACDHLPRALAPVTCEKTQANFRRRHACAPHPAAAKAVHVPSLHGPPPY